MREVLLTAGSDSCVLVYDVGGSHVSASVCFGKDFLLGRVVKAGHPAEQTVEAFLDLLHSLGVEAADGLPSPSGASLAMPGPFEYDTGISRMTHKLPFLFGVDLRAALAQRFGWQPERVHFLNDAAAYLLGEVGGGAAKGMARAVCLTLGTGVGSGFAVDGQVVTAGPHVPPGGEIWNLPYEGGILEDAISTRAIQGSYQKQTGVLREVSAIAADADHDAAGVEAFHQFGHHLGKALRQFLAPFAPDVIVLGGGIAQAWPLFFSAAKSELSGLDMEVRISALMEKAPLVGAGVAWFHAEKASGALVEEVAKPA